MKGFLTIDYCIKPLAFLLLVSLTTLSNTKECHRNSDCTSLLNPICINNFCMPPSNQEDCSKKSNNAIFVSNLVNYCQVPCEMDNECSNYGGICDKICQECKSDDMCSGNKKCLSTFAGKVCGECIEDSECGSKAKCINFGCQNFDEDKNKNLTNMKLSLHKIEFSNKYRLHLPENINLASSITMAFSIENFDASKYEYYIEIVDKNVLLFEFKTKLSIKNQPIILLLRSSNMEKSFQFTIADELLGTSHHIRNVRILEQSTNSLLNSVISIICCSLIGITGIIFLMNSRDNHNLFRNLVTIQSLGMIILLNVGYPISALDLSPLTSIGTFSFINPFNLFRNSAYSFTVSGPYPAFNITGIFLDGICGYFLVIIFGILMKFLSWLIGPKRGEIFHIVRRLGYPLIFGTLTYGSHLVFVLMILQLYNPDFESVFFLVSWVIALVVAVCYVLFMISLTLTHMNLAKMHSVQEKVSLIQRKVMIYGYLRGRSEHSAPPFLFIIMVKNLLLAMSLILLDSVPLAQVIIQIAISIVYILFLLVLQPFKTHTEHVIDFFSELGLIAAKVLALVYYINSSFDVVLGLNITFFFVLAINTIYNSLQLIDKCKSYRRRSNEIMLPIRGLGKGQINNGRILPMTTTSDTQVNNPDLTHDSTFHNTSFDPLKQEAKEVRFNLGETPTNRIVRKATYSNGQSSTKLKPALVTPYPKEKIEPVMDSHYSPRKTTYLDRMLSSFRGKKGAKPAKIDLLDQNLHIDNIDTRTPPISTKAEHTTTKLHVNPSLQQNHHNSPEIPKNIMEEKIFLQKGDSGPQLELNPFGISSLGSMHRYIPHPEHKIYNRTPTPDDPHSEQDKNGAAFQSERKFYNRYSEYSNDRYMQSMEKPDPLSKILRTSNLALSINEKLSDKKSDKDIPTMKKIEVPILKDEIPIKPDKIESKTARPALNYAQEITNINRRYDETKKAKVFPISSPGSRSLADSMLDQRFPQNDSRTTAYSSDSTRKTTNLTLPSNDTPAPKLGKAPESILRNYLLSTVSPDHVVREVSAKDESELGNSYISEIDRGQFKTPLDESLVPTPKRIRAEMEDSRNDGKKNYETFRKFSGEMSMSTSVQKREEPKTLDAETLNVSADGRTLTESSSMMVKDLLSSLGELKSMLQARRQRQFDAIESDVDESFRSGMKNSKNEVSGLGFRVERDGYY